MICVDRIDFSYPSAQGSEKKSERVFRGLSISFEAGKFTAVLGSNGSGKSSLAKLLNGLLLPDGGRITVDGFAVGDDENIWEIRRRVGLVFQDPGRQIVGAVVEDDIAFGLENLGLAREVIIARVDSVLKRLGLENVRKSEPHYLSGGQKQRVALAGVLAMQPDYLVLDEPTAMLDPLGRRKVLNLVKELQIEYGLGIIYITHHMEEILSADRVVVLDKGTVVEDFSRPQDLLDNDGLDLRLLHLQLPPLYALAKSLRPSLPNSFSLADCSLSALSEAIADAAASSADTDIGVEPSAADSCPETGPAAEPIAVFDDVSYTYLRGTPFASTACRRISLEVYAGEVLGIIGATGSGKSTLLQLFNGLLRSTEGTVTSCGLVIPSSGGGKALSDVRSQIGFLFQSSEEQLFETSVFEDVAFGPRNFGLSKSETEDRVKEALRLVNIPETLWSRSPLTLSGGEKRRAALAGVLACRPKCLLLDEPTAGLDPSGTEDILHLLRDLNTKFGMTIVMISHRYEEIAVLADRLAVMKDGVLLRVAPTAEILYNTTVLEDAGLAGSDITRLFMSLHDRGIGRNMRPVSLEQAVGCCQVLIN